MTDERAPEDVLAGVLRIRIDGEDRLVPTLKIREVREWVRLVTSKAPGLESAIREDGAIPEFGSFVDDTLDTLVELVCAYDKTGALGGPEYLEAHADPAEVFEASRQMGEVAFPFVRDLRSLRLLIRAELARYLAEAAQSAGTSSTNGRSPSGASTRPRSKIASTRTS